jgi:hypothetical protein
MLSQKPHKALPLLCFALCSCPALALDSTVPENLPAAGSGTVDMPLAAAVGPLRAGKLCLPNGKVRVRDFVSSQSAFAAMVTDALAALAADRKARLSALGPPVSVHLVGISAKLCAKEWGAFAFGDRKSLSGDAAFAFEWGAARLGAVSLTRHQVVLKLKGGQALPPPEILNAAVTQLLTEIADQGFDDNGGRGND